MFRWPMVRCIRLLLGAFVVAMMASSALPVRAAGAHVMRFADGLTVQSLNPLFPSSGADAYVAQLTGGYLTRLDAHGRTIAELAATIPSRTNGGVSADGKTITFRLRPGLRWSDGASLTARDLAFTAHLIAAPETPIADRSGYDLIDAIRVVDERTIRFHLRIPSVSAATSIFASRGIYAILPAHVLAGTNVRTASFNEMPVGAGPFRVAAFRRGESLELEANPYYLRGRPKLDRLVYKAIPADATIATQLLTGELDLALHLQPAQLARLTPAASLRVLTVASSTVSLLTFNTEHRPFDDPRVRRALRLGLDRDAIARASSFGTASVTDAPFLATDPYFAKPPPVRYDPARAAALLDAAGWRRAADGMRHRAGAALTATLVAPAGISASNTIRELVRAAWTRLGVQVDERAIPVAGYFGPDGALARGTFDAAIVGTNLDPDNMASLVGCATRAPKGFNFSRRCDPRTDALLAQADRTFDEGRRRALFAEAQQRFIADAADIILFHRRDIYVERTPVRGFAPNGVTVFDAADQLDLSL